MKIDREFYRLKDTANLLGLHEKTLIEDIICGRLVPAIPISFHSRIKFSNSAYGVDEPIHFSSKTISLSNIKGIGYIGYILGNNLHSYEEFKEMHGTVRRTSILNFSDTEDYFNSNPWVIHYEQKGPDDNYLYDNTDTLEVILTRTALENYFKKDMLQNIEVPEHQHEKELAKTSLVDRAIRWNEIESGMGGKGRFIIDVLKQDDNYKLIGSDIYEFRKFALTERFYGLNVSYDGDGLIVIMGGVEESEYSFAKLSETLKKIHDRIQEQLINS